MLFMQTNILSTSCLTKSGLTDLSFSAICVTCIAGMIRVASRERNKAPPWEREHGKEDLENWLTNFFAKLKRTSTRTQKCRLISSVERMEFEDDWQFVYWKYVRFGEDEAEIFDKHNKLRQKVKITEFQKGILESDESLRHTDLSRSDINEENGEWKIPAELKEKLLSRGGEALVFSETFGDVKTAVRLQIFDPLLFTEGFGLDSITPIIHFEKDFKPASYKEDSENDNKIPVEFIPRHPNVIKNFVNVELFQKSDAEQEDCLGWITIMEMGGTDLRKILKRRTAGIDERKSIAEGIENGLNYLENIGIKHSDLKLENFLVLNGDVKIIDFGLVEETSGRRAYRKMGYARRGSRFRNQDALSAATPGFAVQKQFSLGTGYDVKNHWFFLFCDWETSWTLLYRPIDENEEKGIDEIVKRCNAWSIHQIKEENCSIITEITKIISIPSSVYYLDDQNLTKSINVSELKQNATRSLNHGLQNFTENVLDQKNSNLCVPICVATLLRFAMKNDLDWDDDVYEFYSTEKILATIAVIIYPRSMAGLNLNPNENETDFQSNAIETLLKRLCKKTYLMEAGWEIIRQLGPRRIYQPVKSICRFEKVLLNENFIFTRPLTITCAFLLPDRVIDGNVFPEELIFHQMVLDRIENKEYVIMNNSTVGGGPVLRIPKTRGYYVNEEMLKQANKIGNEIKLYGSNGEEWRVVNDDYGNMKPKTWYILPQAYSITLKSKQTNSMTVQQKNAIKKLNSEDEMKEWLTGFLPKLKRTTERTAQCRLILSVERMLFDDHKYAASWQYVRFGKDEAEILDKDKTLLQKIKITEFQKMILKSHEINAEIDRRELKAETGKWTIPDDLNKRDEMSEGGEALVFTQKFEGFPIAVRVHIFDPYLFTAQFPLDKVTSKAHFEKDFAKARDKAWDKDENDEKKHNQMPNHKNVIKNYVNFELFHKEDADKEDCLGWVTVMEKADGTLKTILKQEIDIDDRIDMAEVIWSGYSYLQKIGIEHFDFKLDNVLLLNGVPKIIDFGLICETTGRTGYREMGYSRRGSKFRNSLALHAATPGFAQQQQFAEGNGYNVSNFWYFLICDWETSWTLLYMPIEEKDREDYDEIVRSCRANFLQKGIKESGNLNFSEIKTTISIKNKSDFYCINEVIPSIAYQNLIKTCRASNLPEELAKKPGQDLQNLTKDVIDQKDSQLCVPISVSILLKTAMEKDLDFKDTNAYYATDKILATLTLIVYPRSYAGLNLNPNKNEFEFQKNDIETLLKRLCKKTYLMDSGWEIIRQIGPAGMNQPKKSICEVEEEILNENFKFTLPLTVTGAYLSPNKIIDGQLVKFYPDFHQMTLDRVDNPDDYDKAEYVLANTSFKQGGPVVKIPRTRAYYGSEDFVLKHKTGKNEYKYEDQKNGYFMKLVNDEIENMKPDTWYLLPRAFSIKLVPE